MGRRSGRAAARRATAALENTPQQFEPMDDDETMVDADPDAAPEPVADPADDDNDEDVVIPDDADKEDSAAEDVEDQPPAGSDAEVEAASAKSPSPPPVQMIRRKRLGRPPKNRPPDWDNMIEVPAREGDTPRRRGRGGWRGRGGRKGQPTVPTQQSVDKDGTMMDVVNDEVALPEDADGETKVDRNGYLQGGREYRCRTFTVAGRGERLYMLSTEPARCVGFRDSYLFFTKHLRLVKVIVDDEEKRDMIEREIIPHSYKGRSIGIVTARSVFREFGSMIVVGGRRIIDDYEVTQLRAEGVVEGEIADPNDRYVEGEPYNKNQYVAWHGASSVYHSAVPVAPQQVGGTFVAPKKRRVAVNDSNWMFEHAREASTFNSMLTGMRMANLKGVYDLHTNMMQYPATMQPTHARVKFIPAESPAVHGEDADASPTIFKPLSPSVPRNFRVIDYKLETPPTGIAPASYDERHTKAAATTTSTRNNGSADFLAPFRGLAAVPDDVAALLPPECRAAFDEAVGREREWHARWGSEKEVACRRDPVIDKAIVPSTRML